MLKVRVAAYPDAQLEVGGIMTNPTSVCNSETSRWVKRFARTRPAAYTARTATVFQAE